MIWFNKISKRLLCVHRNSGVKKTLKIGILMHPYQRNIFEILLNQTEIRLYLPFSDWFGTKSTSIWIQINRKMVNTIWFRVDLISFRKDFSVCNHVAWMAKVYGGVTECLSIFFFKYLTRWAMPQLFARLKLQLFYSPNWGPLSKTKEDKCRTLYFYAPSLVVPDFLPYIDIFPDDKIEIFTLQYSFIYIPFPSFYIYNIHTNP